MKKLIATLVLVLAMFQVFSQTQFRGWNYATMTTQLGRRILSGDYIYVVSVKRIIKLTADFESSATPSSIVTDGHYVDFTNYTAGGLFKVGTYTAINGDSLYPTTTNQGILGGVTHIWKKAYIKTLIVSDSIYTATTVKTGKLIVAGDTTSRRPGQMAYVNGHYYGYIPNHGYKQLDN